MAPSEFWAMHPHELRWWFDQPGSAGGGLSRAEAAELYDELRDAQAAEAEA